MLQLFHTGAAGFFLEEHRLCNPLYSELFVDILQQESSQALRKYISGKECSVMLLNVCFERPLAIIRSEKNASSPASKSSTSAYFVAYGINPMNSYSVQRKLEIARQGIALKRSQIDVKRQEACTPQVMEHLKRELDSARLAYSQELEQCNSQKDMPTERPMTTTALELQHQGFRVVAVLMKYKEIHLQEQNDVVRALRWLWRSRGRHYRLLYQEEIHPRFSSESYMLANFLISYSEANPEDIDVLFDLISKFFMLNDDLAPTACSPLKIIAYQLSLRDIFESDFY
jgi:transformation/transcription domain-associated protein